MFLQAVSWWSFCHVGISSLNVNIIYGYFVLIGSRIVIMLVITIMLMFIMMTVISIVLVMVLLLTLVLSLLVLL